MKIIAAIKGFTVGQIVSLNGYASKVPAKVLGFRSNNGFEYLYVRVTDAFNGRTAESLVRPFQVSQ